MYEQSIIQNCTKDDGLLYEVIVRELWQTWNMTMEYFVYSPWFFSILGSSLVGLAGVFPLIVIPIEENININSEANSSTLKLLLSFAVGGLLGDVFLHLLPEAWYSESLKRAEGITSSLSCGIWVLIGFLVFVIVEKMFAFETDPELEVSSSSVKSQVKDNQTKPQQDMENNNCLNLCREFSKPDLLNRDIKCIKKSQELVGEVEDYLNKLHCLSLTNCILKKNLNKEKSGAIRISTTHTTEDKPKFVIGYLNLMANCIDNFTHGLAVGGAFLVSFRLGVLTTFAILVHEIPHEVGDFAILLRSGFSRWDAARAQLLTASGGILGALVAVLCSGDGLESRTSWILPFTAGGFLHIGLVTILPELLRESSLKESCKQVSCLLLGIFTMALLTIICE